MSMPGTAAVPERARVVVVGGGVIGTSVAYHLAHLGVSDVVLLERDRLTSGTTWHAAGLMATFGRTPRPSTGLAASTWTWTPGRGAGPGPPPGPTRAGPTAL